MKLNWAPTKIDKIPSESEFSDSGVSSDSLSLSLCRVKSSLSSFSSCHCRFLLVKEFRVTPAKTSLASRENHIESTSTDEFLLGFSFLCLSNSQLSRSEDISTVNTRGEDSLGHFPNVIGLVVLAVPRVRKSRAHRFRRCWVRLLEIRPVGIQGRTTLPNNPKYDRFTRT